MNDYNPVATTKGPNYTFLYNDGTGSGDIHVSGLQIGLSNADAALFNAADEATRQALLKRFVAAHEERMRARKQGGAR